jgi:hypothetical protein
MRTGIRGVYLGSAFALIALLAIFAARPAMADLLAENLSMVELEKRLEPVKTWEELCTVVDCSRFPKGYSTWKLDDEYYYFRLESTFSPPEPGQIDFRKFDPMVSGLVERDAEGRIIRGFTYRFQDSDIRFTHCCKWLLDQVGLLQQWPDFKHDVFPWDFDYNDPALHRMRRDMSLLGLVSARYNRGYDILTEFFPVNPDGTRQHTLDQADKSGWISLNDDFWLVDFSKEVRSSHNTINSYRMVTVLSKQPMFNGRYIYGQCDSDQTCNFHSVIFSDDSNPLPRIKILSLRADEYKARSCDHPKPVLNCDTGLEFFDKLKPAFQILELMFERMKTRPDGIDFQ